MASFDVLTRGDVLDAAMQARDYLVTCGVPAALAAKDPRLWGRRAVDYSRLGWLDLPFASQGLLQQIEGLVTEVRYGDGIDHVVLIGVGADTLAAQAIVEADEPGALTVLDGSDAAPLERALDRLGSTLVILSSKVGVSIEGDAYRRIFAQAFRDHGLTEQEIAGRFLVITDHDSPLHDFARARGYRLGLTDPYLPGHFSALSAYGLVPAVLAGANVGRVLDDAASVLPSLAKEEDNPGLLLGAVLGGCAQQTPAAPARDKVALRISGAAGDGTAALAAWVSQLLTTGTGQRGRGILPLEPPGHPGAEVCPDVHSVTAHHTGGGRRSPAVDDDTTIWGPLGAQFLLWEYATTTAGWLLGVNPFEEATVLAQEAEDDAATMLRKSVDGRLPAPNPDFVDGGIEVYGDPRLNGAGTGTGDVREALGSLLYAVPGTGYLSIVTYLGGDFSGRYLAPGLARASGRPVSYGCGPGLLHGTGSFHKEGPRTGAFLVITGAAQTDRAVPGRPYTLGQLQQARALADVRALRRRGLPVLWLHLRDPAEAAARLIELVRELRPARGITL